LSLFPFLAQKLGKLSFAHPSGWGGKAPPISTSFGEEVSIGRLCDPECLDLLSFRIAQKRRDENILRRDVKVKSPAIEASNQKRNEASENDVLPLYAFEWPLPDGRTRILGKEKCAQEGNRIAGLPTRQALSPSHAVPFQLAAVDQLHDLDIAQRSKLLPLNHDMPFLLRPIGILAGQLSHDPPPIFDS